MALPAAHPAEVLRAWQKDDFYQKKLAASLSSFLPSPYTCDAAPISSVLYKSFTTLKDLQTLGEEYSGIIQVDETYHKLPSYSNRLISILLSAFGETFTRKLLRHAETKVEQSAVLKRAAQSTFLVILKTLSSILPQIESIHRALCYISGGPIEIGKTMTSIDYVQVRPAATAYCAHLRLLGVITLLHAFISCGHNFHQAKKHVEFMRDPISEVVSSRSCVACMEELLHPCVLQCGHIFCIQCCYGALQSCALCRMSFTKNTVVPLMNYLPTD